MPSTWVFSNTTSSTRPQSAMAARRPSRISICAVHRASKPTIHAISGSPNLYSSGVVASSPDTPSAGKSIGLPDASAECAMTDVTGQLFFRPLQKPVHESLPAGLSETRCVAQVTINGNMLLCDPRQCGLQISGLHAKDRQGRFLGTCGHSLGKHLVEH